MSLLPAWPWRDQTQYRWSADVVIDRRSLLEWLLDPLYAAGRR